jgi:hypothetical protein
MQIKLCEYHTIFPKVIRVFSDGCLYDIIANDRDYDKMVKKYGAEVDYDLHEVPEIVAAFKDSIDATHITWLALQALGASTDIYKEFCRDILNLIGEE